MKTRFVSCQVLLNKDGSLKAQRIYAIPEPSVISISHKMREIETGEIVKVGVMVQEWNGTHDILDHHPDVRKLWDALEKHFGLTNSLNF